MVRTLSNDPSFLNASASLRYYEPSTVFCGTSNWFRNDLLPLGSMPYNEDLKYGVMNKLDLLDLCGFLNTRKFNDKTARTHGQYLNQNNCHCGHYQLRRAHRELLKPDDLDPTMKNVDKKIKTRHAAAMKQNVPLAKKCGLWVRLYPSPSDNAMEYADDGGQKLLPSKTVHCKNIGVRSLIDVIRCRASVRVEAKKQR